MIIGQPLYLLLIVPVALAVNLIPGSLPRGLFVLICSYAYYCTFSFSYLPFLFGVTAVAFFGALLIERFADTRWAGRLTTAAVIAACLCPLLFFKYVLPLYTGSGLARPNWLPSASPSTIPIGLSFYTFAAIGYVADVALRIIPAERWPLRLALFCGFFPIVTSGPIPRTTIVMPQLKLLRLFTAERGMLAITEILTGVAMKLWIADTLGATSATVFSDLSHSPPLEQFLAIIFFAFQLYADFAGYSLLAIGSARLLGVDIPPNFAQPFLAPSIPEFWRRWHMSLLGWLRDYVYMPLYLLWGGRSRVASAAAMFVTLVLMGLWHGAGWGFVVFGIVHGFLVVYAMTLPVRDRLWARLGIPRSAVHIIRVPVTFLIVALTFVLIRANDLHQALSIYSSIFSTIMLDNISNIFSATPDPHLAFHHIVLPDHWLDFALICVLVLGDVWARSKAFDFFKSPAPLRAVFYAICVMIAVYQVTYVNAAKSFIYYQF